MDNIYDFFDFSGILDYLTNQEKIETESLVILNIADVLYLCEHNHRLRKKIQNIYDKCNKKILSNCNFIIPDLDDQQLRESLFEESEYNEVIIDRNINSKTTPMYSLGYLTLKETYLNEHLFDDELIEEIRLYLEHNKVMAR